MTGVSGVTHFRHSVELYNAVCEFRRVLTSGLLVRWSCHTRFTEEATMTFDDYLLHLF